MSACKYSVINSIVQIEEICGTGKLSVNGISANNDAQSSLVMDISGEKVEKNKITIKSWARKPNLLKSASTMQDTNMLTSSKKRVNKDLPDSPIAPNQVSISSSYLKTLMKAPNAFTIPLAALQMLTNTRGDVCQTKSAGKSELLVQLPKKSVNKLSCSEYRHKVNKPSIILTHNESLESHSPSPGKSQVERDSDDEVDDDSQLLLSSAAAVSTDECIQSSTVPLPLSPDLIDESSVEYLDSFDPVTMKHPNTDSISQENYATDDYELPLRRGNKRKRGLSTSYPYQQSKFKFSDVRKVSIKKPPRDSVNVNHLNSYSNDSNFFERKSKMSVLSNSTAAQRRKVLSKQLQFKKKQKHSSDSSEWNKLNNPQSKSVTSNKMSLNVTHSTSGSNVIKINPPAKIMQSIKMSTSNHQGSQFVFPSRTKEANGAAASSNPTDMCVSDSFQILNGSHALSPAKGYHFCSSDSSLNVSQLNPTSPNETQLPGLLRSKNKLVISIDTSKNNTSCLQSNHSKLPVPSGELQQKEKKNSKSLQVSSDMMLNSTWNGNQLMSSVSLKKLVPLPVTTTEDSDDGTVLQHARVIDVRAAGASSKQSKEKASQTAAVAAVLQGELSDELFASTKILNSESLPENCAANSGSAVINTVHYNPTVTNTLVTHCVNTPIHYFANTLSPCKPGSNGRSGLRIALPSSVIHTIPVNTVSLNSEEFQIPSMTLMPAVPQYVITNPSQKTNVPDASLAALTNSFTMPTKNGTCIQTNINMPSLEKAFHSSQVLGIGVLPVPPSTAASTSPYKCQSSKEVLQNSTKQPKLKENRILIKVFTGKRFLKHPPPHVDLPKGDEVGAGISIEALEDEGIDLTSLVCDPQNSKKEGPYVFHFPPNPALNRNSGIERNFSANDSPSYERICEVLQRNSAALECKSNESAIKVVYDPETDKNIVIQVTGMSRSSPVNFKNPLRKSKKDFSKKSSTNSSSSALELQRTRSGRISRPPQHRVKDYKLLRPVNYDMDLDNTLGYHDYDPLQPESEGKNLSFADINNIHRRKRNGLSQLARERYTCRTCNKLYMGQPKLLRHYQQYPKHLHDALTTGLREESDKDSVVINDNDKNLPAARGGSTIPEERESEPISEISKLASDPMSHGNMKYPDDSNAKISKDSDCRSGEQSVMGSDEIPKQRSVAPKVTASELNRTTTDTHSVPAKVDVPSCKETLRSAEKGTSVKSKPEVNNLQKLIRNTSVQLNAMAPQTYPSCTGETLKDLSYYLSVAQAFPQSSISTCVSSTENKAPEISVPIATVENESNQDLSFLKPKCFATQLEEFQMNKLLPVSTCSTLNAFRGSATLNSGNFSNSFGPANLVASPDRAPERELFRSIEPPRQSISSPKPSVKREDFLTEADLMKLDPSLESFMNSSSSSDATDCESKNDSCEMSPPKIKDNFEDDMPEISNQSFSLRGFNDFDDVMSKQELETPPLSDGINLFGGESSQLKISISSVNVNYSEKANGKTSTALSPTPGTRPTEVNPEPSLPVETDCSLHPGVRLPRGGSVMCSAPLKKLSSAVGSPMKTARNLARDSVPQVKSNVSNGHLESSAKVLPVASNKRENCAKESSSLKVHIKKNSNDEYFAVTQVDTAPVPKTPESTLTSQKSEPEVAESAGATTLSADEAGAAASVRAPLVYRNQNKTRGRGRGRGRGRSTRGNSGRKPIEEHSALPVPNTLNETLDSFSAAEIASTVFPRLQREFSLWETFCLQASCSPNNTVPGNNVTPLAVMNNENSTNAVTLLSVLLEQCRAELKNVLLPIPSLESEISDETSEGRTTLLNLPENVALAIGMKCGKYRYKNDAPYAKENKKSRENKKSKENTAKISAGCIEQQNSQKLKNRFHCSKSSVSLQTVEKLEMKSSINLAQCNGTPSVSQTLVGTEHQTELLSSVLNIQSTLTEEERVTEFRRLPGIESSLVQATTVSSLVETGSHSTKHPNLISVQEISKNDNPLLQPEMHCDDRRKIAKNVVDCATTLQSLEPTHPSILPGHGNVSINNSSFLVPEVDAKRSSVILEPDSKPLNKVQSKIIPGSKTRIPVAIPCPSDTNSSPFDRPYLDVSKSDPLLGFSSAAVGNSHPGSSSFIISITNDPISSVHNSVNSNQMNNSSQVKSNLLSDREEKPMPSPIEFSPLSFAECTTSYDLSSFLLQGSTPPLDTNAGGKSPVRTVQDGTLPPLCNSAKFSQTTEAPLDVTSLQTQSTTTAQRSNSLNDFISPSLEVPVPFSNESNNMTDSSVYAFRDRPADLEKTNVGQKPTQVEDNLTYQENSLNSTGDNTNGSKNELRYNACPNSSSYIPSSVFDTLYCVQPNTLPNVLTKLPADNQTLSTSVEDSNEITRSAPPPKKSRKSIKEKNRSNSSFLSKFTNANFKEVDTPSSNQPIASLIHSQSMAEKNNKVDEKKNSNSNVKKKTPKKRDAAVLPKVSLNSDNSAVYGPLQDSSHHNISENGSIIAQPATSPISALLQSSFHSVLTQDAAGVTCSERPNIPSHPFTDSSLSTISEQPVSRNLSNQSLTYAESPGNSSAVNCNYPSTLRTVVSPAGFHPASSPTQSFTFPISACRGSGNGAVDGNNLSINSSLPSSFDINSNAITSSYVASLSTFIPPSTQCVNVSAPTFNSMPFSSQPHHQHPSISSPKSSCCPSQTYSSSSLASSYVLTSSMPSPSNSYVVGPNMAQKTFLRNGSTGISGSMTPPPFSQNCFPSALVNSSVPSFPRITSPVMNHDGSMLYTSSRIAAGSSMSPPLSSLLPTSHVNHHGPGAPASPLGNALCTNSNVGRNSCATPFRGSTRPLLSPTTLLGLPFSSISPDFANLEPPLPCTSGSIPALSELELASDDLPRLLSTGDSSSQSCGASKLLDTNTADLTEIIQKLQQETADSACLETSDGQLSASIANEFRPPAPSFKGVLQSKTESDSVCVHSASLNETRVVKANGLSCFGVGSTTNQNPASLVASVQPRSGMCQSNSLRHLQISDPSLSPNCTMITSFTDVLSSNVHFSNTALPHLTSSTSASATAEPDTTHRNGTIQCQEETALLRQVTSTETIVQNILNVMPMNMGQRVQNNPISHGKLVNSISHCDQLSSVNENGSQLRIQSSPVHSKILPVDQSMRSVKSSTLQESNLLSRSEKIISNSRVNTEFSDQLTSVVRPNDSIGNGVVSNGTHVVFHSSQDLTSPENVPTFPSLPHNSLAPSGREQHTFSEATPCEQFCGFSHDANDASDTDFGTVTRGVNGDSTRCTATTTAPVPIANITYDY